MVDEEQIRQAVESRHDRCRVDINWLTPGGNPRSTPQFEVQVANEYLSKSRTFRGPNRDEMTRRASEQVMQWKALEITARCREARSSAKERAQETCANQGAELQGRTGALRSLLSDALTVDLRYDWSSTIDVEPFRPFYFGRERPQESIPVWEPNLIQGGFSEHLLPSLRTRRLEANARVLADYAQACKALDTEWRQLFKAWEAALAASQTRYASDKAAHEREQTRQNEKAHAFRRAFEQGKTTAIIEYLTGVFERSIYPDEFCVTHSVAFEESSGAVVVNLTLPPLDELPSCSSYRYIARTSECLPVEFKRGERADLYDAVVKQVVLRTAWEVFGTTDARYVKSCAVNGWVTSIDPSSGNDTTACIVSVHPQRNEFEAINLSRVDVSDCIRGLKGLVAGPLAQLSPVKPLLQISTVDDRFINGRDVLGEMNSFTNLAEISWQDFEHLVREMFAKLFSGNGMEVKVTRSSSDGGVDAVAFDTDPIRGGKFVIQAKRYSKVVPVAAVRELYGTMINEGASKGIIVTTAHYGEAARAFARGKPLTLIDGSNLVHMLHEQGHKVRIDIKEARAKREPS